MVVLCLDLEGHHLKVQTGILEGRGGEGPPTQMHMCRLPFFLLWQNIYNIKVITLLTVFKQTVQRH